MRNLYQECIKNSYNSIIKSQVIQFKIGRVDSHPAASPSERLEPESSKPVQSRNKCSRKKEHLQANSVPQDLSEALKKAGLPRWL